MGAPKVKKSFKTKLKGDEWTRFSISVWDDISKTQEERELRHPAMFPSMLVRRLIKIFSYEEGEVVLDPFLGVGSTLVAAGLEGRSGVGFEIVPDFAVKGAKRLGHVCYDLFSRYKIHFFDQPQKIELLPDDRKLVIFQVDARKMIGCLSKETNHLCISSLHLTINQ